MSDALLSVIFVAGVVVSLGSSWVLVVRLERVGARLGLSEALLGMLAALAADAPEITAAVTALARHDTRIGAGVVIGSNVFNLAALLGLAAVVAGRIALHRRVIELGGAVALWTSLVCLVVVAGLLSPVVGLLAVLAVLAPYLAILGMGLDAARAPAPSRLVGGLAGRGGQGGGARARGCDPPLPRRARATARWPPSPCSSWWARASRWSAPPRSSARATRSPESWSAG